MNPQSFPSRSSSKTSASSHTGELNPSPCLESVSHPRYKLGVTKNVILLIMSFTQAITKSCEWCLLKLSESTFSGTSALSHLCPVPVSTSCPCSLSPVWDSAGLYVKHLPKRLMYWRLNLQLDTQRFHYGALPYSSNRVIIR